MIRSYKDLVPAVVAIYAHCPVGCHWHVVLDDGNYGEAFVDECCTAAFDAECVPCVELARLLGSGGASATKLRKAAFRGRPRSGMAFPTTPEGDVRWAKIDTAVHKALHTEYEPITYDPSDGSAKGVRG